MFYLTLHPFLGLKFIKEWIIITSSAVELIIFHFQDDLSAANQVIEQLENATLSKEILEVSCDLKLMKSAQK